VQDNEKKRLRDFRESFEEKRKGSKLGAFSKRAWAHFPRQNSVCAENYCCVGSVLYGSVHFVQQEEGTIFKAVCGHGNRGCFEHSLLQKGAVQIRLYSRLRAQIFEVLFSGWVVQQYGLGTIFKADFWRDSLGVVSGFLLAVNVILLLI
jgi:hypothetical protein